MIRLMIGRDLKSLYVPPATPAGSAALAVLDARTQTYPGRSVRLTLRHGEIIGLAGLVGSGRTELARAVFGIDCLVGGALRLDGEPIRVAAPDEATSRGIFLVSETRKRSGLLLDFAITDNISLPNLKAYSQRCLVSRGIPFLSLSSNWETRVSGTGKHLSYADAEAVGIRQQQVRRAARAERATGRVIRRLNIAAPVALDLPRESGELF